MESNTHCAHLDQSMHGRFAILLTGTRRAVSANKWIKSEMLLSKNKAMGAYPEGCSFVFSSPDRSPFI